jgi:uncharacterized ferritin-like protein (DUF455 family)
MDLDPRLFAEGPARDARFTVRDVWSEMDNMEEDTLLNREFLHRQMNEEVNGLEMAARNLADFPDAPWELRMSIARQCWDESRHVQMFRRCYERRGGRVGEHPVLNFQYRIITRIGTLIGRLGVQNRSFEAAGIDGIQEGIAVARARGEDDLVELLEAQLADEVEHVRYANHWIKRLAEDGGARAAFELARAVAHANEAMKMVAGENTVQYAVAEELRREAGFSDGEIDAVKEARET